MSKALLLNINANIRGEKGAKKKEGKMRSLLFNMRERKSGKSLKNKK